MIDSISNKKLLEVKNPLNELLASHHSQLELSGTSDLMDVSNVISDLNACITSFQECFVRALGTRAPLQWNDMTFSCFGIAIERAEALRIRGLTPSVDAVLFPLLDNAQQIYGVLSKLSAEIESAE